MKISEILSKIYSTDIFGSPIYINWASQRLLKKLRRKELSEVNRLRKLEKLPLVYIGKDSFS
jgi:hypothetical protein